MDWTLPMAWTLSWWDGFMNTQGGDFTVAGLGSADVDEAAAIHADAFRQSWSGEEFDQLLRGEGVFGFLARRERAARPEGLVLARRTLDEAEILTVGVRESARGRGVGRLLLDNVLQRLHAERVAALFLEVEETNAPALALYHRLRFEEVGRRPAYYAAADGTRSSALVLKRALGPF